jgi:predicted NodU family carbamoyl transferase
VAENDPTYGDITPEQIRAVNAEYDQRKKIVRDIEVSMKDMVLSERTLVDELAKGTKRTLDFSNILEHVLKSSKTLGKEFKTVEDIQQRMQTDAKFFKKMQQEIGDVARQRIR